LPGFGKVGTPFQGYAVQTRTFHNGLAKVTRLSHVAAGQQPQRMADDRNRAGGVVQDAVAGGAEQQAGESAAAAGPDDGQGGEPSAGQPAPQ
jgi:hypothetical protein